MEFKLAYSKGISQNPCGVFVEDTNMMTWVETASQLGVDRVQFFPVPGNEANTVSGALLISDQIGTEQTTRNPLVYNLGGSFYVLSNSHISPQLNELAIIERFGFTPHFFHPVYGLIELEELTDWAPFFELKQTPINIIRPEIGPRFPTRLGEYFIREIEPEDVLKSLIEKSVPQRKSLESKPLSSWEKLKLKSYRFILGKNAKGGKEDEDGENSAESISDGAGSSDYETAETKKSWWKRKKDDIQKEFENLEERNKKELDKLMDMLKKDPDEALKYALPIDRSEYSRGPEVGYTMQKRWGLGFPNGSGSGGSVNLGESKTDALRRQYTEMAQNYENNKDWEKASFVYMELLSNPHSAAEVLKRGKKYEAAAAIYLSKCKNKPNAAECYELGRFYGRAIDLYEELDRQEKIGDLYTKMGNEPKAKSAYGKEITKLSHANRYFEAGEISLNKLTDHNQARSLYMEGWNTGNRQNDCLNQYLNTYDLGGKRKSIDHLHDENFEGRTAHHFLEVLKLQLDKNAELHDTIEVVAYETISRNSSKDKAIVNLVQFFNKSELVSKDVMRFKSGR